MIDLVEDNNTDVVVVLGNCNDGIVDLVKNVMHMALRTVE